EREYLVGASTTDLFEDLFGLPVDGEGLVRLLGSLDPESGALPRIDGLRVEREPDRILVFPEPARPEGFQRLEVHVREMERVTAGAPPDYLFAPPTPAGWRPLDRSALSSEGPLLLP